MAPRVGRKHVETNDTESERVSRKPVPDALRRTTTAEGVMSGVQPKVGHDSTRQVYVGCKLPNGVILRLFRWIDDRGTPKDKNTGEREKIAVPATGPNGKPQEVRLRGPALRFGAQPRFVIAGGYALTPIDADFWEKWADQNKGSSLIENKLLFAMDTPHAAEQEAVGLADVKSGFEPVDPNAPPSKAHKHITLGTADLNE